MTPQESQELKTYLEQRFDGVDRRLDKVDQRLDKVDQRLEEVDQRLDGIDGRLGGIDTHLDRQDIDFNKTTMNLLRTIDDATKESRRYSARLFGILDRPPLDAEGVPKPAKPSRSRRPGTRSGR